MKVSALLSVFVAVAAAAPLQQVSSSAGIALVPASQHENVASALTRRLHKRISTIATDSGIGIGGIVGNSLGSGVGELLTSAGNSILNIFRGGKAPPPTNDNSAGLVDTLRKNTENPSNGPLNYLGESIGQSIGAEVGVLLTQGTSGGGFLATLQGLLTRASGSKSTRIVDGVQQAD